ncbi:MAG: hypothetical protein IJ300_11925 [Clostridia bacterium]|nr:hypothetical protein [Clostridia bacterium]
MTLKNEETKKLFDAILTLKNADDCSKFFEDICTIKELQSMAQRLEVADLLRQKKTFSEIVTATGASTATISRVNKCLMYGPGGYKLVLDAIEG